MALIARVTGINCTRRSRVLFGPVTSAINARIAQAGKLLLVNHMLDCSSSRQDVDVSAA